MKATIIIIAKTILRNIPVQKMLVFSHPVHMIVKNDASHILPSSVTNRKSIIPGISAIINRFTSEKKILNVFNIFHQKVFSINSDDSI
ncbi:MAG: hypothetical protein ACOZBL_05885 [Patescibacteria group bacterium]